MILDYFRPKTLKEAIDLHNSYPNSRFLGGGSSVRDTDDDFYVIDLQLLGLNHINRKGNKCSIGATVTLDEIYKRLIDFTYLTQALQIENSKNQRNQATLGGLLMTVNGKSPVLTSLVSMKSHVYIDSGNNPIEISEFLESRNEINQLITKVEIELPEEFVFESVARTPLDKPVVCCAISKYVTGARIGLGGFGLFPIQTTEESFLEMDEKNIVDAFSLVDDQWASASFRASVIKTLGKRLLN